MAPEFRAPVPVAQAQPSATTEDQPVLAKFDSRGVNQQRRSFSARNGEIVERLLPAFGVLAQGTQIRVPHGTASIEDLGFSDEVCGSDGRTHRITWIGEVTLRPDALGTPWLRRVQADRFGFARPLSDVILGAGALIPLGRDTGLSRPLSCYDDDEMVTAITPPAPVRLFQIGCAEAVSLTANGLPVDTLNVSEFLDGQPELLAQMFSKLMPGTPAEPAPEKFVTASPFRRARLG